MSKQFYAVKIINFPIYSKVFKDKDEAKLYELNCRVQGFTVETSIMEN